jgi:low temperature requirement protein LtrA
VVTFGYVIMRLAMVTQWLRAAAADPLRRSVCLRYAAGITAVQVCWVLRLALPDGWALAGFFVLVAAELAIPIWAERPEPTTWHPAHIAERYGLFTIIVLGESVLAATVALQSALDGDADLRDLASLAVGGLLTVFAMWWLYFSKDAARFLTSMRAALRWGYGHYFVFSSAAAVGAGLAVNVDVAVGDTTIGTTTAAAAVTVPVAIFLLSLWLLQWVPLHVGRWHNALPPIAVALVLLGTFSGQPVLATGLVLSAVVVFGTIAPLPLAAALQVAHGVRQQREERGGGHDYRSEQ